MGALGKATKAATARYMDVPVLLDGALLGERDELLQALTAAEREDRIDPREGLDRVQEARDAVLAFEARIADALTTIRVIDVGRAKWRACQLANSMPEQSQRSPLDQRAGYHVVGAAIDAIEAGALVVLPDGTTDKPSEEEWREFWEVVNAGDVNRLIDAVASVCETSGTAGYALAKNR